MITINESKRFKVKSITKHNSINNNIKNDDMTHNME